ncbi:unnamed protein product [Trypanosoma congolense IL3000]|uniref:WGS project CAEQ00000000 data, annotated contig 1440 n=1 Tax=Trypanosoma congolense (strain IL3000) TaxID=1068625 RepID=F9W698_TRYCI|nr:unnamed protein product [Trypanosoma congolense IL3000]
MSTRSDSRYSTRSILRGGIPNSTCSVMSSNTSSNPPPPVSLEATAIGSGSEVDLDATTIFDAAKVVRSLNTSHQSNSATQPSLRSGESKIDGSMMYAIGRRACVEEEAFQRGRIYLQQLESWKDLRVQALRQQPGSCTARSLSVTPRSHSGLSRQETSTKSSSCPPIPKQSPVGQLQPQRHAQDPRAAMPPPVPLHQQQNCSSASQPSLPSPQRSPTRPQVRGSPTSASASPQAEASPSRTQSPQQQKSHSQSPISSKWQTAPDRGVAALLEKHYDREVQRVARREQRMQERELRLMEQRLEEARLSEARAREGARAAGERITALEAQLSNTQKMMAGVTASGRQALEELQMRERQVEVLSVEVERLRMENMRLTIEHRKAEASMKERVEELQAATEASKRSEEELVNNLQSVKCKLSDQEQAQKLREDALCHELKSHQAMEQKVAEMKQLLEEAVRTMEDERRQAEERSAEQAKALQHSQAQCERLQNFCKEKMQEVASQAEHFKAMLAAQEAAAAATAMQLQRDNAVRRQQCHELQQKLLQERLTMTMVVETQRTELFKLRQALCTAEGELLKMEGSRMELEASRQNLQEELQRGLEAKALLREAGSEMARLRSTIEELKRCGGREVSVDSPDQHRQQEEQLKRSKRRSPRDSSPQSVGVLQQAHVNSPAGKHNDKCSTNDADPSSDCVTRGTSSHHCGLKQQKLQHHPQSRSVKEARREAKRSNIRPEPALDTTASPTDSPCSKGQRPAQRREKPVKPAETRVSQTSSTPSELCKRMDGRLGSYLRALEPKVVGAVSALLHAQGWLSSHLCQEGQSANEGEEQKNDLTTHPMSDGVVVQESQTAVVADCVAKLLDAVSALSNVLPSIESMTYQLASNGALCSIDRRLADCLKQQRSSLHFFLQELELKGRLVDALKATGELPASSAAGEVPLIRALVIALDERIETLLAISDFSGNDTPPPSPGLISAAAAPSTTPEPPASFLPQAQSQSVNGGQSVTDQEWPKLQSPPSPLKTSRTVEARVRHKFGAMGGRLEASGDGTHLHRLPLPSVVDIMSRSALGALSHHSAPGAQQTSSASPFVSPPAHCFAYTIRISTRCDNVLMGFADSQLPLEVFPPAMNSVSYTGCYYLHLGHGTLYCPRLGIADVPYPDFARSGPVSVCEEVSCELDIGARTIKFTRGGADCGVAFEDVDVSQPLFPAFEFNSAGGAIEFV